MNAMTIILSSQFESALIFANQLHQQQIRRVTGVPYMSHLLSVCALVLEDGGSEDEAISALLHDAIEDQGGAIIAKIIREKFGDKIADIVEECTEDKNNNHLSWIERKQHFINQFITVSNSACRVILADKLHNARCNYYEWQNYQDSMEQFSQETKERIIWFYQSIFNLAQLKVKNSFLISQFEIIIQQLKQI